LTSAAGPGDTLFSDALNHASIIDGCRLSGARVSVYRHADVEHLESLLRDSPGDGRRIVVTDAVFSMDGDLAPLRELRGLADRYGALLFVDEAHSVGVYGRGAGLCAEAGVTPDAMVANLAKAFGGAGGFVAASSDLVEYLVNSARSFIFSTGLAPASAAAGVAAIRVVRDAPGLGEELLARATYFRNALRERGVEVPGDHSAIVPIHIGENAAAVAASQALLVEGVLAVAIRPPSVPRGTARLRCSVTLAHSEADLTSAAQAIAEVLERASVS
jgi:7-keto-8-aminopelargonate synthetase-like enzyme